MSFRFEAHRGVGTEYPESTMPAFEAAVREEYALIELDPKFTSDGHCVILHDRTLNRTARCPDGSQLENEVRIADITLEEAMRYDYGLFKSPRFAGTKLVTLEEVLAFCKANPVGLKFDNVIQSFTPGQLESFCQTIEKAEMGNKVGFTCKTTEFLAAMAARFPEAEFHYDGPLDQWSIKEARRAAGEHRLTYWVCFPNEVTQWYRGPRANEALCDEVKEYGELGLWLLQNIREFADALCYYKPDCIETDGGVKPEMIYDL